MRFGNGLISIIGGKKTVDYEKYIFNSLLRYSK